MNKQLTTLAVYARAIQRGLYAYVHIHVGRAVCLYPSVVEIGDFDIKDKSAERSFEKMAVRRLLYHTAPFSKYKVTEKVCNLQTKYEKIRSLPQK